MKQILDAVNKNRNQRSNGFHNIAVTQFQEREQLDLLLSEWKNYEVRIL
ncbi:MAG: hypothetical protein LC658_05915 [Bacteroidales bacterium]|nr:hypothetical protein [Bacteroidales bacterium]